MNDNTRGVAPLEKGIYIAYGHGGAYRAKEVIELFYIACFIKVP
jgi:hypothetical protein